LPVIGWRICKILVLLGKIQSGFVRMVSEATWICEIIMQPAMMRASEVLHTAFRRFTSSGVSVPIAVMMYLPERSRS